MPSIKVIFPVFQIIYPVFAPNSWECTPNFNPGLIKQKHFERQYVNQDGTLLDEGPTPFLGEINVDILEDILQQDFVFLNPAQFKAGNVHQNQHVWEQIMSDQNSDALKWIKNKVNIHDFLTHFKGEFQGLSYDHNFPPQRHFRNAPICKQFVEFINEELKSRLQSGAISYIGQVGHVDPPHIVSPITIETLKPRLCINMMYVNCFMKDTPFCLDTLVDIPRVIEKNSYMSKLDDKSGYDNVLMTNSSAALLGFQWGGHYFTCNTLPFGWKNSAYIYHTLNLQAVSYLRKRSISCLLYIDDRLIEQYNNPLPDHLDTSYTRANIAIRYSVRLLVSLGYYLNISKSVVLPTQSITFLGMIIDSKQCSFFITDKRKCKLKRLRETILQKNTVSVITIQKFVGLCISMCLAIPAAKLYTSTCNLAISRAVKMKSHFISIDSELRQEIDHWSFLDKWANPFPWLPERHFVLKLSSDSSDYKWGAIHHKQNNEDICFSDYWTDSQKHYPIMVKEALALYYALKSLKNSISNKRVIAHVDNTAVIFAWSNQYSKNKHLNNILKDIFQLIFPLNCSLDLVYVPSLENPSDHISRGLTKADAMITLRTWLFIQYMFGKHDIDMFSLDSNAMTNGNGQPLKHFTPVLTPLSGGVDAFAQCYHANDLHYAFPPFVLLPAVIHFVIQEKINTTLIFPEIHPIPPWYVLLMKYATIITPVGYRGDKGVLLYPSKKGYLRDKCGLQRTLSAAQIVFHQHPFTANYHRQEPPFYKPVTHRPVLFVGDSMIRFISNQFDSVQLVSVGGAKLLDCLNYIISELKVTLPFMLLCHVGTNDINKKYKSENRQMHAVKKVWIRSC